MRGDEFADGVEDVGGGLGDGFAGGVFALPLPLLACLSLWKGLSVRFGMRKTAPLEALVGFAAATPEEATNVLLATLFPLAVRRCWALRLKKSGAGTRRISAFTAASSLCCRSLAARYWSLRNPWYSDAIAGVSDRDSSSASAEAVLVEEDEYARLV